MAVSDPSGPEGGALVRPGLGLADRVELRELIDRYALAADRRDPELMASCYTPDGVSCVPAPPENLGPTSERRGRDAIRKVLLAPTPFLTTLHAVVGQVIDDTDPDHPTGAVATIAHHLEERDGALTDTVWHLRYQDTYGRDGTRWCIARRELWCDWIEQRPVHLARRQLLRNQAARNP